ncbi:hypothetical protein KPL26_04880 [Clostridium algidicarnis]|uniref:hypothetical protein n=1 Tax=Clostridium algidicarnis TaxID=37659 RepID=UPI001C0B20FA|nr:hypothetical protein [Clostridium algidicarnis]MBU3196001.1 hypothetical protein [Clostridium algidicarnis]
MDKNTFSCLINAELLEKFKLALTLNKQNVEEVIEKLLSNYISESFLKAAKDLSSNTAKITTHTSPVTLENNNYSKANRKIPVWANREKQNNHKIIKAFLQIEEEQGQVTYEELMERCSNATKYSDTYVSDFKGNFAQMKTDASNSHGKVFIVEGDNVEIWSEVLDTLRQYRDSFLNSNSKGRETMKITNEMTHRAYEIIKMVHCGNLTRNEAKYKIADETGMNAGSAGDYVTNFLAMMEGQRYTRTMNTYATRYLLENIRLEFGEEQFQKALEATKEHVKYYNGLKNGTLHSIQNIIDELS